MSRGGLKDRIRICQLFELCFRLNSGMPRECLEKVRYSELGGKEAALKLEVKNEKAMQVTIFGIPIIGNAAS